MVVMLVALVVLVLAVVITDAEGAAVITDVVTVDVNVVVTVDVTGLVDVVVVGTHPLHVNPHASPAASHKRFTKIV